MISFSITFNTRVLIDFSLLMITRSVWDNNKIAVYIHIHHLNSKITTFHRCRKWWSMCFFSHHISVYVLFRYNSVPSSKIHDQFNIRDYLRNRNTSMFVRFKHMYLVTTRAENFDILLRCRISMRLFIYFKEGFK